MQRCLPEQRQRVLFPSPELAAGSAACPGDTQLSVPGASWKVDGNKLAGLPKQLWWRQQGRPTEPCSGRLLVPPRTSSWLCPQAHRRQLGHHGPRDHPGGVLGSGDVPRATLQPVAALKPPCPWEHAWLLGISVGSLGQPRPFLSVSYPGPWQPHSEVGAGDLGDLLQPR